jgi:hypothetical protein
MSLPLIVCNGAPECAFGERYFAFGSLSVRENMFLLSRMVFNIISWPVSSPEFGIVDPDWSSGKNFFIKDSIIGKFRI